jgi:hypothetical protein
LLTGHDWSKRWKAIMKIEDNSNCDVCNQEENGEHIVLHCSKYDITRSKYSFVSNYSNLINLYKSKNLKYFKEICNFVKDIKIDL